MISRSAPFLQLWLDFRSDRSFFESSSICNIGDLHWIKAETHTVMLRFGFCAFESSGILQEISTREVLIDASYIDKNTAMLQVVELGSATACDGSPHTLQNKSGTGSLLGQVDVVPAGSRTY